MTDDLETLRRIRDRARAAGDSDATAAVTRAIDRLSLLSPDEVWVEHLRRRRVHVDKRQLVVTDVRFLRERDSIHPRVTIIGDLLPETEEAT